MEGWGGRKSEGWRDGGGGEGWRDRVGGRWRDEGGMSCTVNFTPRYTHCTDGASR